MEEAYSRGDFEPAGAKCLILQAVASPLQALQNFDHEFYGHPIGRVRLHFRMRTPRYVSSRRSARAPLEW